MEKSGLSMPWLKCTIRESLCSSTNRMIAPAILEIREGIATPATPIFRTKMQTALPTMLIRLIRMETFSVIAALPIERNRAAQAL